MSIADTPASIAEEFDRHRFFTRLDPDMRRRLAQCAEHVEFPADHQILTEGQPANSMYAILKGRVAVGVRTPHRGLQVIDTLQRGDILGWSWLFEPYLWTFDAITVKPVRAIEVHVDCIRPYLDEDPLAANQLLREVAAVMAERLASARLRLIDMFGAGHDGD